MSELDFNRRYAKLIEGDFHQRELYEEYLSDAENDEKKMLAALRAQDYNARIDFIDKDLLADISMTLHHNEFFTGKRFESQYKKIYEVWFELIDPQTHLRLIDLEENLEALNLEPYSDIREEVIQKTEEAIAKKRAK